ncbi:MAG: MBOAT family protein [Oligoflexia bacterium]|nr:MBOAT family protein [Oligoflexia bacterium]
MFISIISLILLFVCFYTFPQWNWFFLLAVSFGFYWSMAGTPLLITLMLIIVATYFLGHAIKRHQTKPAQKYFIVVGIAINLLPLLILKYAPHFVPNLHWGIIGVSFFTFQAIAYLIDISTELAEPEDHFGHYALYLAFFPKVLQGPIERAHDLLPQLKSTSQINWKNCFENLKYALFFILLGAFKKFVVADRITPFVDEFYDHHVEYMGPLALIPLCLYSFQIYFDFSGYTDAALGVARLFGVKLTDNFRSPYFAVSVADFWRRWHISLSRWLMDYLYKPISFSLRKQKTFSVHFAIFITFLVCGLWHGTTFNFVIWGCLHGSYIILAGITARPRSILVQKLGLKKSPFLSGFNIIITFLLITLTWIFFRAENIYTSLAVLQNLFCYNNTSYSKEQFLFKQDSYDAIVMIVSLITLFIFEAVTEKEKFALQLRRVPFLLSWCLYSLLLFVILFFSVHGEKKFIYFEF